MKPTTLIVGTIAAGLLLAGCGGSSSSSEATDEGGAPAPGRANATDRPGSAANGGDRQAKLASHKHQAVVYTATLRVRADDVGKASAEAKWLVTAAGGYVGNEHSSSDPDDRSSATITFKIPSDKYAGVLKRLGSRLGERLSLTQKTDDVTSEVADINSRVKSAKATLASFRKLLDRATSVDDIMKIEQEIAERESDLESLEARQRALAHKTAFATVTLALSGPPAATKKKKDDDAGFVGALESGWHAFVAFFSGLAVFLAWVLPFLVLAAVIGVPVWRIRRRLRRRRSPEPPAVR